METDRKELAGSAEVGCPDVNLNLIGQSISKLNLCLGTLQKEYLDIPKLLNDSRGRLENTIICQLTIININCELRRMRKKYIHFFIKILNFNLVLPVKDQVHPKIIFMSLYMPVYCKL